MKKIVSICAIGLICSFMVPHSPLQGQNYQNFNHGYYSDCDCGACPCPCPPDPTECECDYYNNGCDYQNGYDYQDECAYPSDDCPEEAAPLVCDPAAPCAPVCGTNCGISCCAIGVGIIAVAAAAAIIVSSGNGTTTHAH